jgi:hypothetical protein
MCSPVKDEFGLKMCRRGVEEDCSTVKKSERRRVGGCRELTQNLAVKVRL